VGLTVEIQARTVAGLGAIEQVSAERSILVAKVVGEPWVKSEDGKGSEFGAVSRYVVVNATTGFFDVDTNAAAARDSRLVTEVSFTVTANRVAFVRDRDVR
jgi:hypothetical protein